MQRDYKCIIDIGSDAVGLTGVISENGNCGRCFRKVYPHGGIKNNFFINPEKLFCSVEKLVNEYSDTINHDVLEIYLILPQRFFRFKHEIRNMPVKNGIVNKFDVSEIIENSITDIEDCEKLECVPVAFKVKDDFIDNPIGQECENLTLVSVTVGILTRILEFFVDMSKRLYVSFYYVPAMKPLLDKLQNTLGTNRSSRLVIYFNESYIDVCYCEMRAVIAEKTIEVGNSDFIASLAEICRTDIDTAKELITHINFNLIGGEYVIGGTKPKIFNVNEVNASIIKLYQFLADEIKKAIETMVGDSILPVYIAGEAVCSVRGADKLFTEKIGMPVNILIPDLLLWNTSADYIIVGLIESICK